MFIPPEYPHFAPPWLYLMKSRQEARQYFPAEAMKRVAERITARQTPRISWNGEGLAMSFGPATFRYVLRGNQLVPECNCSHDGDGPCIHEYIAYIILLTLSQRHHWRFPQAPTAGSAPPPASSMAPASKPPPVTFFRDSGADAPPRAPADLEEKPSQSLVVEIDHHCEPGQVQLYCYRQTPGSRPSRELMIRQGVLNAAMAIRKSCPSADDAASPTSAVCGWPWADAQFLVRLAPLIATANLDLLRRSGILLDAGAFRQLQREFSQDLGRFICRDTQRPLPPPGQTVPVRLSFAVSRRAGVKDKFQLHARVELPGGQIRDIPELLASTGDDTAGAISRAGIFSARFPVPWGLLVKHFSHPVTTISCEKAPELLTRLLDGHLELLETGKCVRIDAAPGRPLPVELRVRCDAAAFTMECLMGGRLLEPERAGWQRQSLGLDAGGVLVIRQARPSPLALQVLGEMVKMGRNVPEAKILANGIELPATAANALLLRQFWLALPPAVIRKAAADLAALLDDDGAAIEVHLAMRDCGPLVETSVDWRTKNGLQLDTAQLRLAMAQGGAMRSHQGSWLHIDPAKGRQVMQQLIGSGVLDEDGQAMIQMRGQAHRSLQHCLESLADRRPHCSSAIRSMLAESPPALPRLPEAFRHILRDYQREGVDFLSDRILYGAGPLLADDMGLGKTIQVLALLESWRQSRPGQPCRALVVCPAAVISVWQQQAARFCPALPVSAHIGNAGRRQRTLSCWEDGLLVCHYGIARQDLEALANRDFDFIILDEAQNIKNPKAQSTIAIKQIKARHRVALTGTPLENRLADLWSIMDFLNPGLLGTLDDFSGWSGAADGLHALARRIGPLMLRRTKTLVAGQLPPRTVDVRMVSMTPHQRELYRREQQANRVRIHDCGAMGVLAALTRLRQLCCSTELLYKEECAGEENGGSAKLQYLLEKCAELISAGHSVLVFSQFTTMLDIIRREMDAAGIPNMIVTGQTPLEQRAKIVDDFNGSEEERVLLLSLKAAGTGLTLTRADYVFLYDPWWNPAVENQAIDRTHRIGQTRPVFAYRLVTEDSVEEHVLTLLREKQELFDAVVDGAAEDAAIGRLDRETLLRLL